MPGDREQHRRVVRGRARATPIGSRWWPRSSKNAEERLADLVGVVIAELIVRRSDDRVAAAAARDLAGSGARERAPRAAACRPASVHGRRRACGSAACTASTRAAPRCRRTSRSATARRGELLARADRDGVRAPRRSPSTYSGSPAPPTPRPRRWPTVKRWCAAVAPEHACRARSTIAPGRSPMPPWRARNAPRPVPARKQRSCESGLVGDRQAVLGGDRAHLRPSSARRAGSACRASVSRRQRGEHVGSGPWRGRRRRAAGRRRSTRA